MFTVSAIIQSGIFFRYVRAITRIGFNLVATKSCWGSYALYWYGWI